MNYDYIEQLIKRYWEAETTQEEEEILRAFFAQQDVPEHLQQYAPYFSALQQHSKAALSADFESRVLSRVEQAPRVVEPLPLTLFDRVRPYFRAAAAVAIVVLIGSSVDHGMKRHAALREARLAEQTIQTDTLAAPLETLRDIPTGVHTAVADSSRILLP